MRAIVLLAAGFAAVAAVPANPQRIVGGTATTIENYPAIAALLYSYFGTSFSQSCGGSIITTRAILTAAHCTSGDPPSRWRVRVGSTYSTRGGDVHTISQIFVHPLFDPYTIDNDVSVLRTANAIVYSEVVRPAPISGPHYNVADNQVVWAAGWGTTRSGGSTSEELRHVQLWTVNQDICRKRYTLVGANVTQNMMCSGWLDVGGRDQCQGDSGGPLYHNGIIVGVCSWGFGCAQAQYPGVNTRVSRFAGWIEANAYT